jgi:hypothetical protein
MPGTALRAVEATAKRTGVAEGRVDDVCLGTPYSNSPGPITASFPRSATSGVSFLAVLLDDQQYSFPLERGKAWPWNGYELKRMKQAGRYPAAVRKAPSEQQEGLYPF